MWEAVQEAVPIAVVQGWGCKLKQMQSITVIVSEQLEAGFLTALISTGHLSLSSFSFTLSLKTMDITYLTLFLMYNRKNINWCICIYLYEMAVLKKKNADCSDSPVVTHLHPMLSSSYTLYWMKVEFRLLTKMIQLTLFLVTGLCCCN